MAAVNGRPVSAHVERLDRVLRYGEDAGRATLARAVRRLAMTSGRKATYEVLKDIEAVAGMWADNLLDDGCMDGHRNGHG